jgi:hypothetical protein
VKAANKTTEQKATAYDQILSKLMVLVNEHKDKLGSKEPDLYTIHASMDVITFLLEDASEPSIFSDAMSIQIRAKEAILSELGNQFKPVISK